METKKIFKILYCAVFFAACLFLSVGLIFPGASDSTEGGNMPHIIRDSISQYDPNYEEDFENWFSKSFAYRGRISDWFSSLRERIFLTGNDEVIVGHDGFLFFHETIDSYTGADPLSDSELDAIVSALGRISDKCSDEGVRFLFVCVPNKSTIYPEYVPRNYREYDGTCDLDRLNESLDRMGIDYLDLRSVLTEAKGDGLLYFRRDTHWNKFGAGVASLAILDKLGLSASVSPYDIHTVPRDFQADLDALLYPHSTRYDDNPTYERAGMYAYTSAFSGEMDMTITTRSAGKAGKLLIFRDSYGSALIEFLACDFSSVRFERTTPYRTELIRKSDYDTVIVEISERKLRELLCK